MKFLKIICVITTMMPFSASAENFATIISITPNYSYNENYRHQKSCSIRQQPIYGNRIHNSTSGGDVLAGMIIGGLFGKELTGKEKGAAAGAVIGGIIAADARHAKQSVVGYKPVTRCKLIKVPQSIKTIKNYRIDYEWNGVMGSSYTYNNYVIGQLIPISINIIAK